MKPQERGWEPRGPHFPTLSGASLPYPILLLWPQPCPPGPWAGSERTADGGQQGRPGCAGSPHSASLERGGAGSGSETPRGVGDEPGLGQEVSSSLPPLSSHSSSWGWGPGLGLQKTCPPSHTPPFASAGSGQQAFSFPQAQRGACLGLERTGECQSPARSPLPLGGAVSSGDSKGCGQLLTLGPHPQPH